VRLVVGLGNPGPRYAATRHNAGFRVALALARHCGFEWSSCPYGGKLARGVLPTGASPGPAHELAILMPDTFMNASGESVRPAVAQLGIAPESHLLVVHDDLDLPLERIRLRARGGCGGHRGMQSIAAELDREDFARLRFGIGRPPPGVEVIDYVLSPFGDQAEPRVASAIERSVEAILAALADGMESAMERFNRAPEGEG